MPWLLGFEFVHGIEFCRVLKDKCPLSFSDLKDNQERFLVWLSCLCHYFQLVYLGTLKGSSTELNCCDIQILKKLEEIYK